MRATISLLLRPACRITLFTRNNCGLCVDAYTVLSRVRSSRSFDLTVVDISSSAAQVWRDVYDLDVPVIHVSKAVTGDEDVANVGKAVKLMHRFTEPDVLAKMDLVEGQ